MVDLKIEDINKGYIYLNKGIPYIKKGIRQTVNIYRHKHCCEICGKRHTKKDPLTFHHTKPITKINNISDIKYHQWALPVNTFLKEINSCQLLCRQCHDKIDNN